MASNGGSPPRSPAAAAGVPAFPPLNPLEEALHTAVVARDLSAARLFASDSTINVVNRDGWTPLMVATQSSNAAMVEFLLRVGADVHVTANLTPASRGSDFVNALHVAVISGEVDITKALVRAGADVSVASSGTFTTPLMMAVAYGDVGERVLPMLAALLPPDARASNGAASTSGVDAATVNMPALLNAVNVWGDTVLHQLARSTAPDAAEAAAALIRLGASVRVVNARNMTPVEVALLALEDGPPAGLPREPAVAWLSRGEDADAVTELLEAMALVGRRRKADRLKRTGQSGYESSESD